MEDNFRKFGWIFIILLWIIFIIVELSLNSQSNNFDFKLEALFTGLGFWVIFKEIKLQRDDIDTQKIALNQQITESENQTKEFKEQNKLIRQQIADDNAQRKFDKLVDTYFNLINDINDYESKMDKVVNSRSIEFINKPFRRNTYTILHQINDKNNKNTRDNHADDINKIFGYDIVNYCIKLINLFKLANKIESEFKNLDFNYKEYINSLITPYHKLAIYLFYHNQSNENVNLIIEKYLPFDKKDFKNIINNDDYLNELFMKRIG